jgi:hypothetical protein
MATTIVNNPTNSKTAGALPFTTERHRLILETREKSKPADEFNSGKDYPDEGAPLLTKFSFADKATVKPYAAMVPGLVLPPTLEQIKAVQNFDADAQGGGIRYLREAVVMDVDAKLIISTESQMRKGIFREAHYPSMTDYIKSDHYRRMRESVAAAQQIVNKVKRTRLREAASKDTPIGVRFNPKLVTAVNSRDKVLMKRFRESDVGAFSGSLSPDWDGGLSFETGGRVQPFTPLISGPYNKQLYYFDYLDMHSKAFEAWCLAGDTEIAMLDGQDRTILEIKKELEHKKFVWSYKFNQDSQRIEQVKITHVYEMGEKECVCVLLDNGRSFIASIDHPMLLRDGAYRNSGDLLPGDSMMPLYRAYRRQKGESRLLEGYERIYQPATGKWELTHVAVARTKFGKTTGELFYKDGVRHVIHHDNLRKTDNRPKNLKNWTEAQHLQFHGQQANAGAAVLKRLWADPAWRKKHLAVLKAATNTPEIIAKRTKHFKGKKQDPEFVKRRIESRGEFSHSLEKRRKISKATKKAMARPEVRARFLEGIRNRKYNNHKVVAVYRIGKRKVYHIETAESSYANQNFALSIGVFSHNTHNPIAKRIVTVLKQFVLGKGVKVTVTRAEQKTGQFQVNPTTQQKVPVYTDYTEECQEILDRHWLKNSMRIRSKQILQDLIVFGEMFIRYFEASWGLRLRELDPSTVWEIITDPDDVENEFYIHQQYPTQYQWYVDLPVPTIKFIIRQVPALHYFHMKINATASEKRGRSELFAVLGYLRRMKEYIDDRIVRNKVANLFVLDLAVEGDDAAVQRVQAQFANVVPTPGSFFIHNKAAELSGVPVEIGSSDSAADGELILGFIAMGSGVPMQYMGLQAGAEGGKAGALVGTEPAVKTFEDYQELMEEFFYQDGQRVFNRAAEQGEIPGNLDIKLEATYPALAEENRSEKLKDLAFGESMSWWSHRRIAAAAAKEMQFTSYDYDEEQEDIANEDAQKMLLINTAYQQVTKGVDSMQQKAQSGTSSGGTSSGSSGKGASGMGFGKALASNREAEDESPATASGTSTFSHVSPGATTANASRGEKRNPFPVDPRDVVHTIKREAANLRYERREIGRRQDRTQTPNKVRDQKSMDRGEIVHDAKQALKSGNLNKEAGVKGMKWGNQKARQVVGRLNKQGFTHEYTKTHPTDGSKSHHFTHSDGRHVYVTGQGYVNAYAKNGDLDEKAQRDLTRPRLKGYESKEAIRRFPRESMEPFKKQDGDRLQRPRVFPVEDHNAAPRSAGRMNPRGFGANKKERF